MSRLYGARCNKQKAVKDFYNNAAKNFINNQSLNYFGKNCPDPYTALHTGEEDLEDKNVI